MLNGSNFRLVTGPEAEQSLAAWRASMDVSDRLLTRRAYRAPALRSDAFEPWEDDIIKANWPGCSYSTIAFNLGRYAEAVAHRGYRHLGLRDPRRVRR